MNAVRSVLLDGLITEALVNDRLEEGFVLCRSKALSFEFLKLADTLPVRVKQGGFNKVCQQIMPQQNLSFFYLFWFFALFLILVVWDFVRLLLSYEIILKVI